MKKEYNEIQLQKAWNRIKKGKTFKASSGQEITIISPGIWNVEGGPDFLNARIIINDRELTGDVEVHCKASDWLTHGHPGNPGYNNLILHVVGIDDQKNKANPEPPGIPLIEIKPSKSTARLSYSDKFPFGKCVSFFSSTDDSSLRQYFRKAGVERLRIKTGLILKDMLKYGTEYSCLKSIFEACGYKKNRQGFIELFNRFMEHNDLEEEALIEAVLWGESDLLPDPAAVELDHEMKTFTLKCWNLWWPNRKEKRGKINWVRSGVRPLNMPERRVAACAVIIKNLGKAPVAFLSGKLESSTSINVLSDYFSELLKCSHPVWDHYINFQNRKKAPSAVLGKSRALDIIVNAILPSLNAHAQLRKNAGLEKACLETFKNLPPLQSNRMTDIACHRWFMPPDRAKNIMRDASACQGIMHIYKIHCEKCQTDCDICRLKTIIA